MSNSDVTGPDSWRLLGLLGTFYFMIYRFNPTNMSGGQIQHGDFFAAICESFLPTMFGLVIAIPCMTAFQLFAARVDTVSRQLAVLVSYLDEWRRTQEDKANASSRNDSVAGSDQALVLR